MVEYNPRGKELEIDDTTEDENYKLKMALDTLFSMLLSNDRNLADIQRVASKLADGVAWPYLRKESQKDMTHWTKYRQHLPLNVPLLVETDGKIRFFNTAMLKLMEAEE